jgi:hypothetical protein
MNVNDKKILWFEENKSFSSNLFAFVIMQTEYKPRNCNCNAEKKRVRKKIF